MPLLSLIPGLATYGPRLVAPLFPDCLWRTAERDRVAYLTFDDGPRAESTDRLLEVLAHFDARATFFLLGAQAERHPGRVRALHAAGHTVGNHSYTHPDAWRTPSPTVLGELARTTALLEDQLQTPVRWMRPPYGRFTGAMRSWCREHGQRLTMWDVMPGDFLAGTTVAALERRLLASLRPGSVVVLHDNPAVRHVTPAALERVLRTLSQDGWRFAAL